MDLSQERCAIHGATTAFNTLVIAEVLGENDRHTGFRKWQYGHGLRLVPCKCCGNSKREFARQWVNAATKEDTVSAAICIAEGYSDSTTGIVCLHQLCDPGAESL